MKMIDLLVTITTTLVGVIVPILLIFHSSSSSSVTCTATLPPLLTATETTLSSFSLPLWVKSTAVVAATTTSSSSILSLSSFISIPTKTIPNIYNNNNNDDVRFNYYNHHHPFFRQRRRGREGAQRLRRHYSNRNWFLQPSKFATTASQQLYQQLYISRGGSSSSSSPGSNSDSDNDDTSAAASIDTNTLTTNDNNNDSIQSENEMNGFVLDADVNANTTTTTTTTTTVENDSTDITTNKKKKILILMDGFCSYHSGYIRERIQDLYSSVIDEVDDDNSSNNNDSTIIVVDVVSDYIYGYLQLQQQQQIEEEDVSDEHIEGVDGEVSVSSSSTPSTPHRRHPHTKDEVMLWLKELHLINNIDTDYDTTSTNNTNIEFIGVYCESDSGLQDAEELRQLLNVTCYDIPHILHERRNKFLQQQHVAKEFINNMKKNGDDGKNDFNVISKQQLCHSIDEAITFAQSLFNDPTTTAQEHGIIIKPIRGVASESVSLCRTIEDVQRAYQTIISSQIFGTAQYHTSVLVQEFIYGTEYAIDVVSHNGQHKVTAIWKYDKRRNTIIDDNDNTSSNSTETTRTTTMAPFCYYKTELVDTTMIRDDDDDDTEDINSTTSSMLLYDEICDYVTSTLTALGIRYGVTHTEVIVPYPKNEIKSTTTNNTNEVITNTSSTQQCQQQHPILIEVNCRQHNMDFIPIQMNCMGYNTLDVAVVAYCSSSGNHDDDDSSIWDSIPDRPPKNLRRYGCMVHLVNSAPSGYLISNHDILTKMMQLESVYDAEVYPKYCTEGSYITPTIDIRSDAGWVQLIHDNYTQLQNDYQQIINWMPDMFRTNTTTTTTTIVEPP